MLVLSRKPGEKLVIGDGIEIVVTKVSGNRVSLGITAPKEMRIVRGELDVFASDDDVSSEELAQENSTKAPVDTAPVPMTLKYRNSLKGFLPRQAR